MTYFLNLSQQTAIPTKDCNHKDYSKRAAVSTVVGSSGDKVGEMTCKKVFYGRGAKGMVFNKESPISFQKQGFLKVSLMAIVKLALWPW